MAKHRAREKKLEFQLRTSSSQSLVALGRSLFSLVYLAQDLPGHLLIKRLKMKIYVLGRKMYLSRTTRRLFFRALITQRKCSLFLKEHCRNTRRNPNHLTDYFDYHNVNNFVWSLYRYVNSSVIES